MTEIIIIGYGNHGRVIAEIVHQMNDIKLIGYVDPKNSEDAETYLGSDDDILKITEAYPNAEYIIGMGDLKVRRKIIQKYEAYQLNYHTLIHPSAVVFPSVKFGKGTVVFASATVNAHTQLGMHCIVNTGAVIEHDNQIGDNVHIAPRAVTGGQVEIGTDALLGLGAVIRNNQNLGSNVTVGCGAVVVKSIKDGVCVVGNPAERMRCKIEDE